MMFIKLKNDLGHFLRIDWSEGVFRVEEVTKVKEYLD